uniref:Uncharacterized protein n=1 Tax=Anguilla anguilla TaxID=7936 RepID=A0A0E9U9C7_ANGAN
MAINLSNLYCHGMQTGINTNTKDCFQ